jgi:signal peptide peptidase SppA
VKQHKYERQGLLAIEPRAFFGMFLEPPKRTNVVRGDVEIVGISGPLEHHAGGWCDSYDDIIDRVDAALAGNAKTVVLRLDSPGGLVSGGFECARAIRQKAKASGKRLVAYVEGQACSMGYALACAADRIVASESSMVGSIGVIDTRVDLTAQDAAMGVRFAIVTSGARKADGNPHQALSPAELLERQGLVDDIAGVFFALVSDLRGVDAAPLEARVFVGREAQAKGLVDEVQSFSEMLASFASVGASMATKYEEARAALEEAAKGDDEEAKRAKRALAAMDESEEPKEDEKESKAEGDDGDKGDEKKDEKKDEPGATRAAGTSGELAAIVARQGQELAALKAANEKAERQAFLATRPDLPAYLVKVLETKPLAEVKGIVGAIPKPAVPNHAATATAQATRGEGQVDGKPAPASSDHKRLKAMDEAMGIASYTMGVKRDANSMTFGVMPKDEAQRAGKDGAK